MKKLENKKKKVFALALLFTLALTIVVQTRSHAEDGDPPIAACTVVASGMKANFAADQPVPVNCKSCLVDAVGRTEIYTNGVLTAYRYSISTHDQNLNKVACHADNSSPTVYCTAKSVTSGDPQPCDEYIDVPVQPAGTGTQHSI